MLGKLVLGAGSVILLAVSPLASEVVPERDSEGLQVVQEAIESAGGARSCCLGSFEHLAVSFFPL